MADDDGTITTESLQHSMVEKLMAIIGAPDDEDVARSAAEVVRALDARLTGAS
ncbi:MULTISPECIES: hypothetical protein [Streptomyces]|uniref:Uncharacterized protein n=1 Tax=Streptomyces doudnae TaxID=3075536 RepID=A0ABD5EUG3_9ACTN|nr:MULTISPECIES: hypothetical protein [unclassified Streptomyces]MDT0438276.1 hypothetical protein [Streptomyces sp. DSM 41981]MYQ67069.1 hypothetical protein [Streptomyces sp. SID4950]SCE29478.1 hypothetical protein GA0115242_128920 [Streptomyces sp. SolWspMP-5a-2]